MVRSCPPRLDPRPWPAALVAGLLAVVACGGPRPDAVLPAPASPGDGAWLRERSMLLGARTLAAARDESTDRSPRAYGLARPDALLDLASVWFNAYPASLIAPAGDDVLEAFGDPAFLDALDAIGVQAIHAGPMKRSGAVVGRAYLPTVDGYFDRIELAVDPAFGSGDQYRRMVAAAAARGIAIVGDIVPGHTGKGPDFRLAELGEPGFGGLYTMAEIRREDWGLLPPVAAGEDSANLSRGTARALADEGFIAGPLEAVNFAHPGIKESNWPRAALFAEIHERATALTTGERGPYNEPFAMSPGVCSTPAGFAAASLGVTDLDAIGPGEIDAIRSRHLAAAAYNALQPGAFVVSGWDLVGALPVSRDSIREQLADNDCRWLNRGGYDLAGVAPGSERSAWGLPRARSLYGSVLEQLGDPASFASRLRAMLAARERFGVDRGRLVAVPTVVAPGLAVLVIELGRGSAPDPGSRVGEDAPPRYAVSAVNFGAGAVRQAITDPRLTPGEAEVVFSTREGPVPRPAGASGGRLVLDLAPAEAQLIIVGAPQR